LGYKLGFSVKQAYHVQMEEDSRNKPQAIVFGMWLSISDETCHVIENGKRSLKKSPKSGS